MQIHRFNKVFYPFLLLFFSIPVLLFGEANPYRFEFGGGFGKNARFGEVGFEKTGSIYLVSFRDGERGRDSYSGIDFLLKHESPLQNSKRIMLGYGFGFGGGYNSRSKDGIGLPFGESISDGYDREFYMGLAYALSLTVRPINYFDLSIEARGNFNWVAPQMDLFLVGKVKM